MLLVHGPHVEQEGTKSHPFSAIIYLVLFCSWTAGWGWLPTSYQGKSKFSCETWKPFTIKPDSASAPLTPFAKLTLRSSHTTSALFPKMPHTLHVPDWAHCSLCLHGLSPNCHHSPRPTSNVISRKPSPSSPGIKYLSHVPCLTLGIQISTVVCVVFWKVIAHPRKRIKWPGA